MNETMQTILNRRSIRAYKEEQITDEALQTILEAGRFAPSAMNNQPWHFVVIQNKELLEKIVKISQVALANSDYERARERAKSTSFNPFHNAPTIIMVFCDEKAVAPHNDGSLALGNMFLAAESMGIGSCWLHAMNFVFSAEEGKKLKKDLGIPEDYIPIGSGAFGYKTGQAPAAPKRKEDVVTVFK